MAIHFAVSAGIPYCGESVSDETKSRVSRWSSQPTTRGKKTVVTQVETTGTREGTDCTSCLSKMDDDGVA